MDNLDAVINQNSLDHLFQLFALCTCLVIFWFLESVYRLDKRWLVPICIFPLSLFMFIILYWEESRAKCFFGGLLLLIILFVGGLVGYSFLEQIFSFFAQVAFWPFYLFNYLRTRF